MTETKAERLKAARAERIEAYLACNEALRKAAAADRAWREAKRACEEAERACASADRAWTEANRKVLAIEEMPA